MPSFESRVVRLNDMGAPRFRVEFIGDKGQNVAVECLSPQPDGDEPSREQIIAEARRVAREAGEADGEAGAREGTIASAATGLMRPVDEVEGRTHSSEGRDRGTG